ncbi:dioxygenase [Bordetella petrii]|uniref:dioxygenase family protein n=1 Tax=Bordetella petrii TaxID=94624 RepID=UPI001E610BB9|nr:class III extradiol ring-cleavage dioxygenase [Bordetella petrii]MCD0502278.1 dioxygenase [Bordetella petrii]
MSVQPVIFVSHGAPTFALEPGRAGALLAALGQRLPRPDAVLIVSPHWMTRGLRVTAAVRPETIHDFGGFPAPLYALQYPAPGAPAVAARVAALLGQVGHAAELDNQRGLDHGAWVPLMHMFPAHDVPVVQLSLPATLDPAQAWELGRVLAPLSAEGVLIVGSGSLTHNLYEFRQRDGADEPYVQAFADWARQAVRTHDRASLVGYLENAPQARRAHPTAEHYLPLLIAAGAAAADADVEVLDGGISHGVLSMDAYVFNAPAMH